MSVTEYNAKYFINLLGKIPSKEWTDDGGYICGDRKCALGHLGARRSSSDTELSEALYDLFFIYRLNIYAINDGDDSGYTQKNTKARVMAALKDIALMEKKLDG